MYEGADFLDFISLLDFLPHEEIALSSDIIQIALSEFPYNYCAERNISIGPFMEYYVKWLSDLNYHDISCQNISLTEINPNPFSSLHTPDFSDKYKEVLAYSESSINCDSFVTSKLVCGFDTSKTKEVKVKNTIGEIVLSVLADDDFADHISNQKLIFEHNPKHDQKGSSIISFLPLDIQTRCQVILENSIKDDRTSSIRYGLDEATGELIKFREHRPNKYHGYVIEPINKEIPAHIKKILLKK